MKRLTPFLLCAAGLCAAVPPYAERSRAYVDYYAHPKGPGDGGYATIAAKLKLHEDPAWCSKRLLELLAAPTGDMFWMFPVTAVAELDNGQLTPAARAALRSAWKTYSPYRGDTENHWLLYYTSLYLAAQRRAGLPGSEWYTGKSSIDNQREAQAWIESWMDLTITRGQGEYDCTHYMGVYLLPMSYLAAWSEDPKLKKRATMMMEYLMLDFGAENLDGLFIGAHARTDDRNVLEKRLGVGTDFAWLLFGSGVKDTPQGYPLYYVLASNHEAPDILVKIATDRSKPYTHYERKRTRNRWRFHDELHGQVYKTTYVRKEYAVGSDQGGVLQPVQQHSWDVTWNAPATPGIQNTFFTLNPFSSNAELQTYFMFSPDAGSETVYRSKKSYDSPDKLLGGSPSEKILQDQDTLIALYQIDREVRFPHINGFFSKDLAAIKEDPSGWIFMRGGDALIAVRPLQPYSWKPIEGGGKRLFSPHLHNGVVVQVAAASEFPNLEAFATAILALPLSFSLEPRMRVQFRSLRGKQLDFTWGSTPRVDGKPLDYATWPLFGGSFAESAVDSRRLVIKYGDRRRILDFPSLTIREE